MQSINLLGLCKKIQVENVNVVINVITPWHLHGAMAVLEKLLSEEICLNGYICVSPTSANTYILNENDFENLPKRISAYYFTLEKGISNVNRMKRYLQGLLAPLANEGDPLYLIMPKALDMMLYSALQTAMPSKSIYGYIIDEGLGSYMRSEKEYFMWNIAYKKSSLLKKIWVNLRVLVLDEFYKTKIVKRTGLVNFNLLVQNRNNLKINQESVAFYLKSLQKQNVSMQRADDLYEDAVVINTQPFTEDAILVNDVDVLILQRICLMLKEIGCKIVLKPHPRESNLARYECLKEVMIIADSQGISQESMLASMAIKPKVIIGFSSTTLVTAQILFGVPTISLSRFFDFENLNPILKMEQERFLETFSKFVFCPNTIDDLQVFLKS